ncbi:MAG: hypothetical protein ACFFCF_12640, partial [Promethearchaeota archaeon]
MYLFIEGELRVFLEVRKENALAEIEEQDANYILNVNFSDFCKYLFQKYSLEPIVLDETKISVDQQERDIDVSGDPRRWITDRSRPFFVKGTKVTYFIPFKGNLELFKYKPSTYTYNPPMGHVGNQELELSFEGVDQAPEQVRQDFERRLADIKKWLSWVSADVGSFNESLSQSIEIRVKARQERLLKAKGLVADLGFPLKQRENVSTTYIIPEIRRKIVPKPTASIEPYKPEPSLGMDDYEHILNIINNMALVMERSPKAFQTMREEDIRQHFLVQLNGQYEGQATGETFNYEGKTDILIRYQGKNIFIAECKFWNGAEALRDTIDQMLNYVSWRDTKTAILLFNRNKNLSSVLSQIPSIAKKHSNFKSTLEYKLETGFRYIFHQKDDKNRELFLTIMVFDVPS